MNLKFADAADPKLLSGVDEERVPEEASTPPVPARTAEDRALRACAIHEAGHGVVAYRLGLVVTELSIEPQLLYGRPISGLALTDREVPRNTAATSSNQKERIVRDVSTSFGGFIAQWRYDPESDVLRCCGLDFEGARKFLEGLFVAWPGGVMPTLFEAYARAHSIVDANWFEILSVADYLLATRRISAETFRIIMDGCELQRTRAVVILKANGE